MGYVTQRLVAPLTLLLVVRGSCYSRLICGKSCFSSMAEKPDTLISLTRDINCDVVIKEPCLDNPEETADQEQCSNLLDQTCSSSKNESQRTTNKKSAASTGAGFFKAAAGAVHRIKKAVQDGVSAQFSEFFVPKGDYKLL